MRYPQRNWMNEEASWEKLWFPRLKGSIGPSFRSSYRGSRGPELTEGALVREMGAGTLDWGRDTRRQGWCVMSSPWFVGLLNVEQRGEGWLWAVWSGILDFLFICFCGCVSVSVSIHCPLWR